MGFPTDPASQELARARLRAAAAKRWEKPEEREAARQKRLAYLDAHPEERLAIGARQAGKTRGPYKRNSERLKLIRRRALCAT